MMSKEVKLLLTGSSSPDVMNVRGETYVGKR
jgi:hypothetical protein